MDERTLDIVLIEDEATHAELIRRAFARQATRIHLAVLHTLQDGRQRLAACPPDLAIVDLFLPDGQGLDLLPGNGRLALYPVLVMTSHGNERLAVEAMRAGAVDYVVKTEATLADMPAIAERALRTWEHVTQRWRAEDALRRSEERYRELFENATDMVYTHDLTGNFTSINRAAERITGYSREQALSMNISQVIAPEYLPLARQMTASKLAGTASTIYELEIFTKAGKRLTVEVSSSLIFEQGQPVEVQGIGRDITERKRLEAQLHRAQRMEAIGTLAGGIAHDFNNILTAILGFTELALDEQSRGSTAWRSLHEVLTAGQRARALINQILTFSRQTAQMRTPVQLSALIDEVLTLLRASLPSTITIRQRIAREAGTILADSGQVHQVLLNLCANAAHAMRQTGGILEIRMQAVDVEAPTTVHQVELPPGSYLRVVVRDTGCGMTPDVLERIFEPFFTTKGPGEGTGMGLALVHGIISSHGGVIAVASTPQRGTTVEIFFPRLAQTMRDDALLDEPPPTGTGCILFVDDEDALVRLGEGMLTRLGYEVVARTSSVEALAAFRAAPQRFNLVITDQTMPNMTGEALARELRRIRPDIPIILCTGFSYVVNTRRAQALGLDAFCMKPLVMRDLANTIQHVLMQRAQSRQSSRPVS